MLPVILANLFLFFMLLRQITRIFKNAAGSVESRWDQIWEFLFVCVLPPLGIFLTQDQCGEHPFDPDSLPTTFTIWGLFAIALFTSKYYKQRLSPGLLLMVSVMLLMGFLFCTALCIHFTSMGLVLILPFFNLLFISPLFCLLYLFVELNKLHRYFKTNFEKEREKQNAVGNAFYRLLKKYPLGFTFYCLIPFLVLLQACLYVFGQKSDSLIRQFTDSCGFLLSYQQSCSCGGDHYLCSIAANGDKKLVRPVRMGIRKNEKILVNRQLLIANAFEHWLEEFTPRFHKRLRRLYDSIGIPVNTWSKHKPFANSLYILMKPLEWFFLVWLYVFDKQPETRIATQYLPKEELNHFIKNKIYETYH